MFFVTREPLISFSTFISSQPHWLELTLPDIGPVQDNTSMEDALD
jgi:hypothetical protein